MVLTKRMATRPPVGRRETGLRHRCQRSHTTHLVGTRIPRKGDRGVLRSPLHERAVPAASSWDGAADAPRESLHGSGSPFSSSYSCWERPSPYPSHLRREGKEFPNAHGGREIWITSLDTHE